jgi:hypothetical protein
MFRRAPIVFISTIILLTVTPIAVAQESCVQPDCVEVAYGIPESEMLAYPVPDVQPLLPDSALLGDRVYHRVNAAIEIHDSPNGNVLGSLAAGFNFVTTLRVQDGWAEINPGQWVRFDQLGSATVSQFAGVLLAESLPYPMAWALVNIRPSRTPGAEPLEEDARILRYTRLNLYASVELNGWVWYQVGPDQWVHQTTIGKVLPVQRPAEVDTYRWISVDLYEQVAVAYEGITPVFATLVSSGLAEWPTNEGLFHIYARYERTTMSGAEGKPDFYYLEEVPWTMYFDNDIALHGTYWHDGFGYRHSHGCVNLSITDAYWLFNWTAQEEDWSIKRGQGTVVYVYSSGQYR